MTTKQKDRKKEWKKEKRKERGKEIQKRPVNKLWTDQMVKLLGMLDCELMSIQQVLQIIS